LPVFIRQHFLLMMMRLATVFILTLLLSGCTDDDQPVKDPYAFETPSNFPSPVYTFENNPVSKRGVELGQMLFYDPVLSLDSSIACANCHQQAVAFSDPVHRFSRGVDDAAGFRNAPAIQNMAFQNNFFWDGGVKHLDFVPINAVTSKIEMAETLEHGDVVNFIQGQRVNDECHDDRRDDDEQDAEQTELSLGFVYHAGEK